MVPESSTTVAFFVPGVPAPQGSKTIQTRGGKSWLRECSKKVPEWRRRVSEAAAGVQWQLKHVPLRVKITFVMPRIKAMGDGIAPQMVQRPDLDKLIRSTFDGMTGVVFEDDSQVVHVDALKRRARNGEATGCHIEIFEGGFYEEGR